jgi:hypothetical protein
LRFSTLIKYFEKLENPEVEDKLKKIDDVGTTSKRRTSR